MSTSAEGSPVLRYEVDGGLADHPVPPGCLERHRPGARRGADAGGHGGHRGSIDTSDHPQRRRTDVLRRRRSEELRPEGRRSSATPQGRGDGAARRGRAPRSAPCARGGSCARPRSGAGMSIACSADIVVAAESARFTLAYTRLGLSPDGSATWFLPRLVGLQRALDLVLTNRTLTAQDALEWGIVSRVVPDDRVADEATAVAQALAAGASAPTAPPSGSCARASATHSRRRWSSRRWRSQRTEPAMERRASPRSSPSVRRSSRRRDGTCSRRLWHVRNSSFTLTTVTQVPVAAGLFTWPSPEPQLIGSQCAACGAMTFPQQQDCPRCYGDQMEETLFAPRGTLWTFTTQEFIPKSPPYARKETEESFGPSPSATSSSRGRRGSRAGSTATTSTRCHRHGDGGRRGAVHGDEDGNEVVTYAFRPVQRSSEHEQRHGAIIGIGLHPFGRFDGVTAMDMGVLRSAPGAAATRASTGRTSSSRTAAACRRSCGGDERDARHDGRPPRAHRAAVRQRDERLRHGGQRPPDGVADDPRGAGDIGSSSASTSTRAARSIPIPRTSASGPGTATSG